MHLKNGNLYNINVTEERFLVTEEVFLVVEDKVCFFCLSPCAGCKPDRGMMYPAENTRACSRDFQPDTVSMARKRHFASGARGLSQFLSLPTDTGTKREFHSYLFLCR